jgi:hypothetical protein
MKKEQRNLLNIKAYESFKLFGFSILINILSALALFVYKSSSNVSIGFYDDFLFNVIIPFLLTAFFFCFVFIVKWMNVVNGNYDSSSLNISELNQLFTDSIIIRKVFNRSTIDEKKIQMKRLVYMIKYCFVIEIIGEQINLKRDEKELFLKTHSFINMNITAIFDEKSDIFVEWELLNQNPDYTQYVQ